MESLFHYLNTQPKTIEVLRVHLFQLGIRDLGFGIRSEYSVSTVFPDLKDFQYI